MFLSNSYSKLIVILNIIGSPLLLDDIVSHRTADVEEILEENKEKISKQTNKKVKELIEILDKDDITEEDTEFIKKYNTKIMTTIYDNRKELKKKIMDLKV